MKKRIFAIILSIALIAMVATACGVRSEESSSESSNVGVGDTTVSVGDDVQTTDEALSGDSPEVDASDAESDGVEDNGDESESADIADTDDADDTVSGSDSETDTDTDTESADSDNGDDPNGDDPNGGEETEAKKNHDNDWSMGSVPLR